MNKIKEYYQEEEKKETRKEGNTLEDEEENTKLYDLDHEELPLNGIQQESSRKDAEYG